MSKDARIAMTMPWLDQNPPKPPRGAVLEGSGKKRVHRLQQRVVDTTTTTTTTAPPPPPTPATALSAVTTTPRVIPVSKRRTTVPWYLWLTWVWLGAVSIIALFTLLSPPQTPPPAAASVAATKKNLGVTKTNPHHVKVYPFNLYEGGSLVRYPRDGGIPQLDWASVKHFEACCRDDISLHCFTASELALKRDPARTARGLPDVYMEISLVTTGNTAWVQVGSRCQLIWSTEKADVEQS